MVDKLGGGGGELKEQISGGSNSPTAAGKAGTSYSGGTGGNGCTISNGGTGGLLVIFGNSINNQGNILAQGANWTGKGGASGGGSINIFYKDSLNIEGGHCYSDGGRGTGGNGGSGTTTVGNISTGVFAKQ